MRTQKNKQRVDGERSSCQRKKGRLEGQEVGSGACSLRARGQGGCRTRASGRRAALAGGLVSRLPEDRRAIDWEVGKSEISSRKQVNTLPE